MKPRHAELLASDLDKNTLIRYIDRFLMFYIRTADRLQRTSTWRDHLEGGLDYLRQVICEDKLGIGAELETDMANIVATYECEWKKALEDPTTLKRFRHFVNSDAPDSHVVFVEERGQIRPATASRTSRSRGGSGVSWNSICEVDEVLPDTGVCALLNGRQIAIFRCAEGTFALDNLRSRQRCECPVAGPGRGHQG